MKDCPKIELLDEKTTPLRDQCITETDTNPFPLFKYYTAVRLMRDEIPLICESRVKINSVPHFFEFDKIFFRALHEARLPLSRKPLAIKKQFVMQLMSIISQDCAQCSPFLAEFLARYQLIGVERHDCEQTPC